MSDIPPIQSAGQMANYTSQRTDSSKPLGSQDSLEDQLEISETGQLLSSLHDSTIRADRVAELRQAIAEGNYETPDKIEATVDRLLDVLRSLPATA